jgi:hypothetical protein
MLHRGFVVDATCCPAADSALCCCNIAMPIRA